MRNSTSNNAHALTSRFNFATPATWLLTIFVAGLADGAAPTLDHLYPAGAQRGTSVEVTATGTWGDWPVKVTVGQPDVAADQPGVVVEAAKDKGKLQVTVDANARPGVYLLRLHNQEGASSPRPFIVGTLPETLEAEPNEALATAQAIDQSSVINGRLEKSGDVDAFAMSLKKGQTLVAAMTASRQLASPLDGVLQICDDRGFVVEQNDDGRGTDPLLTFTAPRDGTWLVRAFAFPETPNSSIQFAGAATFVYRLTLTTDGFVDAVWPLAVQRGEPTDVRLDGWNTRGESVRASATERDAETVAVFHEHLSESFRLPVVAHASLIAPESCSLEQPLRVDLPCSVTGRIDSAGDEDVVQFVAKKGEKLRFRAESRTLGYPLDPVLRVRAADGKVLSEVDDVAKVPDPTLNFTVPADGEYSVAIRDLHGFGGRRYMWRMSLERITPDFALTVAADQFVMSKESPLEIPVTIARRDGFAEPIEVSITGLPDGVSAAAVESAGKGDTSKAVKLKLAATAGGARGPIRVTGRSGAVTRTATFTIKGIDGGGSQIWLTVKP